MLKGIDISNHQGANGFKISNVLEQIDFCICKATEGCYFTDGYCDIFVQTLKSAGKKWGFYHFAGSGEPESEAEYFITNCRNYFGDGMPVLDWEGDQTVEWVNRFIAAVQSSTGVRPWIYGNPWRFNQGGVDGDCMRWIASYPDVYSPTFTDAESWSVPETDGLIGMWQFCSDGRLWGYSGDLDFDIFYGDEKTWDLYAGRDDTQNVGKSETHTMEDGEYKITIERK